MSSKENKNKKCHHLPQLENLGFVTIGFSQTVVRQRDISLQIFTMDLVSTTNDQS